MGSGRSFHYYEYGSWDLTKKKTSFGAMTDSDFEKNLLFMKPLKEIKEEWIKKLRL